MRTPAVQVKRTEHFFFTSSMYNRSPHHLTVPLFFDASAPNTLWRRMGVQYTFGVKKLRAGCIFLCTAGVLRTTSPFHFSSMHPRMGPSRRFDQKEDVSNEMVRRGCTCASETWCFAMHTIECIEDANRWKKAIPLLWSHPSQCT